MNWSILSLGGGVIVPDKIDEAFLKEFRDLALELVESGHKLSITCGGGQTCRLYRDAARNLSPASDEDLDKVGIASTKLNAELLRAIFSRKAHPKVVEPDTSPKPDHSIIISSGFKPGRSTDYGAVLLAKHFGSKRVYNLTNVDYVYTADPKKDPNAEPIPRMSWDEFKKFTPENWSPGMYTPFDPVAAELARESGIEVVIINGRNIQNLRSALTGDDFKGTVIS